jgi:tetratricopeptide (TPR) repeat protein
MFNLEKICQKTIEICFYLLFLLVPLAVAPWNYELFEFNKMLVVYALTAIIAGAWLIKIVLQRRIIFRRSFWDIPLIIFLLSQVASFLFSIDKHTSFWGYYGRFNGGLLSTVCYLLLYRAFISNLNYKITKYILRISLVTAAGVAVYGILEHFGHSISCLLFTGRFDVACWVQDVQARVFATLGQPNWLAAYQVALIPLTWAFIIKNSEAKGGKRVILLYSLFLILYSCLLFTQSRSGFLAFGVSFLIFGGIIFWLNRKEIKPKLAPFLIVSGLCLAISLIFGTPYNTGILKQKIPAQSVPVTANEAGQPLLISESSDIRKVVWKGAVEIWRHFPVLGTGPETFAYSYYWFRPREHNDLSEWDFLYNKAHNEYLNYAATTGTVGLLSYLLLIGSFIFWIIVKIFRYYDTKKLSNKLPDILISQYLNISILAGFISILITNFFGFSVVITSLFFFLFPAFAVTASDTKDEIRDTKHAIRNTQYVVISLILLLMFYALLLTFKYWQADRYYSTGEKLSNSGKNDQAFFSLQAAIKSRSGEPIYHDELALVSANLAVIAGKQNNATLSAQLTNFAIGESDKAIDVSPDNLNFWKNRTKVFYKMAESDTQYLAQAFESLLHASKLAPTDAKIKYNLALLYSAAGQNETAIKTLEETIILKPNYEDARLVLALFYEEAGQKDKAKEQYQYILDNINPVNESAKEALKKL